MIELRQVKIQLLHFDNSHCFQGGKSQEVPGSANKFHPIVRNRNLRNIDFFAAHCDFDPNVEYLLAITDWNPDVANLINLYGSRPLIFTCRKNNSDSMSKIISVIKMVCFDNIFAVIADTADTAVKNGQNLFISINPTTAQNYYTFTSFRWRNIYVFQV